MSDLIVTVPLVKRFWSKVAVGSSEECWPWQGCTSGGYGAVKHLGKKWDTHRVAYLITYGKIDPGKVVGHKCDNRACCNPSHLEAITSAQNNRDARARLKRSDAWGEGVHSAKSTTELVRAIRLIRQLTGWGKYRISQELGVSVDRVAYVIYHDGWSRVSKAEETGNAPATGCPATEFQSARLLVASPPVSNS